MMMIDTDGDIVDSLQLLNRHRRQQSHPPKPTHVCLLYVLITIMHSYVGL